MGTANNSGVPLHLYHSTIYGQVMCGDVHNFSTQNIIVNWFPNHKTFRLLLFHAHKLFGKSVYRVCVCAVNVSLIGAQLLSFVRRLFCRFGEMILNANEIPSSVASLVMKFIPSLSHLSESFVKWIECQATKWLSYTNQPMDGKHTWVHARDRVSYEK